MKEHLIAFALLATVIMATSFGIVNALQNNNLTAQIFGVIGGTAGYTLVKLAVRGIKR